MQVKHTASTRTITRFLVNSRPSAPWQPAFNEPQRLTPVTPETHQKHRPLGNQSTGRLLCEWAPIARPHPREDRLPVREGLAAMRHLAHSTSFKRLCLEDPGPLCRDWLGEAARHRRQQAESGHAGSGEKNRHVQEGMPVDFRLGDTRTAYGRASL